MEKFTPKKIEKILKDYKVSPSKEWRSGVLSEIRSLDGRDSGVFASFLNLFTVKKLASGVLVTVVLTVIFGYNYMTNTPYAMAMSHLDSASVALEQLKDPLVENVSIFMPTVYAEGSDDDKIVKLIQTVKTETDQAVAISEEIEDPDDFTEVLEGIGNVQAETLDVLATLISNSESETVIQVATTAVEDTDVSNEVVLNTLEIMPGVPENDRRMMKANLKKKVEVKRETRRLMKTEKVEEIMQGFEMSYDEMNEPMRKKYDLTQQILIDCGIQTGEKCNMGKAQGLAVAIKAQAGNEFRREEQKRRNEGELKGGKGMMEQKLQKEDHVKPEAQNQNKEGINKPMNGNKYEKKQKEMEKKPKIN